MSGWEGCGIIGFRHRLFSTASGCSCSEKSAGISPTRFIYGVISGLAQPYLAQCMYDTLSLYRLLYYLSSLRDSGVLVEGVRGLGFFAFMFAYYLLLSAYLIVV